MQSKRFHFSALLIIFILAASLRFTGVNWDQGNHLHPDERFLTMVGTAMKLPPSFRAYLDAQKSSFNPANIGYQLFVYGTLPLTVTKLVALGIRADNYDDLVIVGRILSALMDLFTLLLVMAIAKLLTKKYCLPVNIPLWSGFAYATMVLPIQLAHFFAVDTYLTTFIAASMWFSLRYAFNRRWREAILMGIMLGLAAATKINAVLVVPLNLALIIGVPWSEKKFKFHREVGAVFLAIVFGYMSLRVADPYIFQSANWENPQISSSFIESIKNLKVWDNAEVWFPPAVQWISKLPITYALFNLTVLGVGVVTTVFVMIGLFKIGQWLIAGKGRIVWGWLIIWTLGIFFYQSTQFVKALRYFIYLYPILALWAGIGMVMLIDWVRQKTKWPKFLINISVIISVLIWPMSFMSIYIHPHSRVAASAWIIKNIPENRRLLSEYWDDGLPVAVPGQPPKNYPSNQLPVFDPDTPEKWAKMKNLLAESDYYILTSNRGWGSIPTVPEKYPKMGRFYNDLLAGKLPYTKVAEFTSYPSLKYLGIPLTFPDDWADETFTVYDHPKVMIYQLK